MALTTPRGENRRFTRLVVTVFALGGCALAIVVAVALSVLGGVTSPSCANPPLLGGQLPQLAILGGLIASFVAGGLTSTWSMRAVHQLEHPSFRQALEYRNSRLLMRVPFIAVFLLLTALMALEAWTLFFHVWPITYYVRCANQAGTPLSTLGAGMYSFLAGRWLWVRR